ncbi:MAG TPA: dehydrogenase, partial [Chthoniobacteraceae bacterium]
MRSHHLPFCLGISLLSLTLPLVAEDPDATPIGGGESVETAPHTKDRGPSSSSVEIKFKLPIPPPLSPQQELATFKLPPGFKIEVAAAEPLVEAPTCMTWDDQGRAYVVEMVSYMNDVNGTGQDEPVCRIKRLESSKGDGIFDKATVFVDKLVSPRAIMALGDGVLVGEPPNLIWYHDKSGKGVADSSEILATNFGTKGGQPEHMCNSTTWMMDNWIWAADHTSRYRFKNGKLIAESAPSRGQWGLSQDDWGRPFHNSNSDLLRTDLLPPQTFTRNPNLVIKTGLNFQAMKDQSTWPSHMTPGVNRGYANDQLRSDGTLRTVTATCGAGVYRGNLFPKEYLDNVFIPEPAGNLVKRVTIEEKNGFVTAHNAYEGKEFLTSTDERFRPVNVYTGPDGALYVVDMARGIIQHRFFETYYLIQNIKERHLEQPLNLGRIYRIVPDNTKAAPVKLPAQSAEIVPYLAHANGWVRDTAQRVLVERGDAAVVPAVKKVLASAQLPQGRLQALWTLEGLGGLEPAVVTAALHDADPHVRVGAIRVADRTLVPELVKLANDPSIDVRLQLAATLSAQSGPEVEQALLTLLQEGGSDLLGEAIATGLRGRELEFFETIMKKDPMATNAKVDSAKILPILASCVIAERRGPRVAHLLDLVAALPSDGPRQVAVIEAMAGKPPAKGATTKYVYLDGPSAALDKLKTANGSNVKKHLALLDSKIAWPNKPGVPPPPKIIPLTAEQQAHFDKGKTLYTAICAACHQPGGTGQDGLAP